jgi:hypothetical protein
MNAKAVMKWKGGNKIIIYVDDVIVSLGILSII